MLVELKPEKGDKMNYQEAMDYIRQLTKFGWNPGLFRIEKLMEMIGNPERSLKVIHIGGTNGKGSTSAMVSSILQQAGYKVGLFTSPHLHAYTERIRINGRQISPEDIAGLITYLKPLLEEMVEKGYEHPTEFEVNTAMALLYFSREQVDICVLEVGLGGAIDSTNVVQPLVAVITNVGMDHMDYLGNTIEEIATVKAGIIKSGCRVVTAAERREALNVIYAACRDKAVELTEVGKDVTCEIKSLTIEGTGFDVHGLYGKYVDLFTPLTGEHQAVNAATAVAAVELLTCFGITITPDHIRQGLASTVWPGRLELMGKDPQVLIDGAHNLDGANTLQHALTKIFKYKKLTYVIGMLADKEREKVLAVLAPLASAIVVTKPKSPRAGNWQEMAKMAGKYCGQVLLEEDIGEAIEKGLSLTGPEDMLCITGSLYMIAEAREYLLSKK